MRRKFTSLSCSLLLLLATASAQSTALSFNGTDNYVTTSAYVVPTTGDFTVEFWAYVPAIPGGLHEFVSQGTGTTNGFYIGYDNGGGLRAGDLWQNTGVACPVAKWFHLALVNSSGIPTLYINGVQAAQLTAGGYSIAANASFFRIGQQFDPFNEPTNAIIKNVRVWNIARTAYELKQGLFGTISTSTPGLVAYYKMDDGGTTVTNSTSTTGLDGTVQGAAPVYVSTPIQFANNALSFDDAAKDHVQANGNAAYDFDGGTVEAWINPTLLNSTAMAIVGVRTDGPSSTTMRFSYHVSATALYQWNGSNLDSVNTTIPTGSWTHVAFVNAGGGGATAVYVNGSPIGSFPHGYGTGALTTLAIGVSKNSSVGDGEYFSGSIDEVRLWNIQRSQSDIIATMNGTLTGTETGLVGQFTFDQGIAGGDNTGLVNVADNSSTSNTAQLLSTSGTFALNGSSSNYVLSNLNTILPVTFLSFTAVAKDGQAVLQWQTGSEENSKEFLVERSTDGINFVTIGSVAAAGTSHTTQTYSYTDANPAPGINYYRIKEKDLDSKLTYSAIRSLNFAQTGPTKVAWSSLVSGQAEFTLLPGSSEFYQVLDVNGHKVQQGRLSGGKFYLSGVASGIYIVTVKTQAGSQINTRILVK